VRIGVRTKSRDSRRNVVRLLHAFEEWQAVSLNAGKQFITKSRIIDVPPAITASCVLEAVAHIKGDMLFWHVKRLEESPNGKYLGIKSRIVAAKSPENVTYRISVQ